MSIIHLQAPYNEKKAKVGTYDFIAKHSTLCWQSRGKKTNNKEKVTCKKCLSTINK